MNEFSNAVRKRRTRVLARKPNSFYSEFCNVNDYPSIDDRSFDNLNTFERNFVISFHDICSEFIVSLLSRQRITDVPAAVLKGTIDLVAVSVWLEHQAGVILRDYVRIYGSANTVQFSSAEVSVNYDRLIRDIVCRVSFYRGSL